MIKILQVINNLGSGGAERLIATYVPKMIAKGYQVDILLLQEAGSIYIEELEKLGVNIISLSENRKYSLRNIYLLRKIIKKGRYNIIHAHLFPTIYFVALATLFLKEIKLFYTEHNTFNRRRKYKFFSILERKIYARYKKIICISNSVEKNLKDFLKKDINTIIIYNGIEINKFKAAKCLEYKELGYNLSIEDKLLIMVGSFTEQKDQGTLIEALKFLPQEYKILLIGDGIRRRKMEELTKKLNLKERVIFLGVRKDVKRILKLGKISVLSSKWEGFGLVVVEAMAAEIPVLVTNVEGVREIVINPEQLFEVGNAKELAIKILKIVDNENKYRDIVEKQNKLLNNYDIEVMIQKYIEVYLE